MASALTFEPFGFSAHNLSPLDENYIDWARAELGLGECLKIVSIEQNSLARPAGILQVDIVVSINVSHVRGGQEGFDIPINNITPEINWRKTFKS